MIENNQIEDNKPSASDTERMSGFHFFSDISVFSKEVESATGLTLDFASVTELATDFLQATDQYLILNIKEYEGAQPNNLLFLTADKAFVFSNQMPSFESIKVFEDVLDKPFGRSTILLFLMLIKVSDNHKLKLENIIKGIRELELKFDHTAYRSISVEFERLSDRLEEFHDLLLGLQERRYKQMETQYISFDYRVLIAESLSLQGRCRRRMNVLKDLHQDHEMQATEDLNQRIIKLNDVVKRLTAITIILMLPTLIASHFGMNFRFMPELNIPWVYPAVIAAQLAIVVAFAIIFRKIGWL
jgi:Mg2+ and Co2+ transporter CorA